MSLKQTSFLSVALAAFCALPLHAAPLYQDAKAPLEARVSDVFGRLMVEEKASLLSGTAFTTNAIPRLGIPAMEMADAGQGVRGGSGGTQGPATAFPSGVAMASSWDVSLLKRIGRALGIEVLNKGTGAQVLLGPAVNIQRSPLGGRNGEYFSEDPFLSARLAVPYIQGLQSTGAAACVKHFAANNEEVDRFSVNVRVSERALREIYLPAFEASVKEGHVWTLMSSYNRVNGEHASANRYLLTDVLKRGWRFDGMVMSDWGGVHETAATVMAGNDLEMPGPNFLQTSRVLAALNNRQITPAQLDDNVRRILRTIVRVGLLDAPRRPNPRLVNSAAHRELSLEAAAKGIVLLKNERAILPLNRAHIRSLAVIGESAMAPQIGAAGSPEVTPLRSVSPLEGLQTRAGSKITINYVRGSEAGAPIPESALRLSDNTEMRGLTGQYFSNRNLEDAPVVTRNDKNIDFNWNAGAPAPAVAHTDFSARWTGVLTPTQSGPHILSMSGDDGFRLFLDDKLLINNWSDGALRTQSASVNFVAGRAYKVRVEYYQNAGGAEVHLNWVAPSSAKFQKAAEAARRADAAIVFVSTKGTEGEGNDRPSMDLPNAQDEMVRAVVAANPNTIVVLNNGTPVSMARWLKQAPAVVETWFPGQEGGSALAAILFGEINPSGKLPTTLGARREDYPDNGNFPGKNNVVNYAEGIYVGYRHFDKKKIAPLFPFGHGLSYTTFRYSKLAAPPALSPRGKTVVRLNVTNTGRRAGAEIVQLYLHDAQPKIDKPLRELKGFARVELAAGETKTVAISLAPRDLAYCDVRGKQWKADAGLYEIQIGASSRDIRLRAPLRLTKTFTEAIPFLQQQETPRADANDLAFRRKATSSSIEKSGTEAIFATDGDASTRWSSAFSDPQWLAVDLGKTAVIDRVRLSWESAHAAAYSIQVSSDGANWTDVYSTQNSTGGRETLRFAPVAARHVRVLATRRATEFGASLYSFEVFAAKK